MRFLIDENLPLSLAHWLVDRGFDAEHTSRLGLNATPDRQIARHAVDTGAVIVTKDADYVTLARTMSGLRVVHMQVGNMTSTNLLGFCDRGWSAALRALKAGDTAIRLTAQGGVR